MDSFRFVYIDRTMESKLLTHIISLVCCLNICFRPPSICIKVCAVLGNEIQSVLRQINTRTKPVVGQTSIRHNFYIFIFFLNVGVGRGCGLCTGAACTPATTVHVEHPCTNLHFACTNSVFTANGWFPVITFVDIHTCNINAFQYNNPRYSLYIYMYVHDYVCTLQFIIDL